MAQSRRFPCVLCRAGLNVACLGCLGKGVRALQLLQCQDLGVAENDDLAHALDPEKNVLANIRKKRNRSGE